MTDLSDRVLEAIAETRRHAEELKEVQPTLMRFYVSTPDGRSIVVTSDPGDDLRRCEADKRTVEHHSRVGAREWVGIGHDAKLRYRCERVEQMRTDRDAWRTTQRNATTDEERTAATAIIDALTGLIDRAERKAS